MTDNIELNAIDWKILRELQRDASQSVQSIGEAVGLSANPCWRRIKRMEDAGVITARVALVDAASIGLDTTAFVAIRTNQHEPEWLEAFSKGVQEIDGITECHRMAGDIDYMLKLRVRSLADYDRIYQELIDRVPGLADVTASFSMEEMKYTTALPKPD